jgi:hypothetical protein
MSDTATCRACFPGMFGPITRIGKFHSDTDEATEPATIQFSDRSSEKVIP